MCGEKSVDVDIFDDDKGSPPRVRGKDAPVHRFVKIHGITPACAGKSMIVLAVFMLPGDHPRVCGEKP